MSRSSSSPFNPYFGEWKEEPWPHSLSKKTFDTKTYRLLRDYFPPPEWTKAAPTNFPLKEGLGAFHVSWEEFLRVSNPWAEFYEYLSGVRFYDQVMSHIGLRLEKNHPDLDFKFNCMIRPDMYFYRFYPGLCLDIHRDNALHVMSWVNYFDSPQGGQFVLADDSHPRYYSPDQNMSLLWLNDGRSWHGVTEVKSTRCMCYIAMNHKDLVWEDDWAKYPRRPALPPRSEFRKAPNASPEPNAL